MTPPYVWKGSKGLEAGKDDWTFDEELVVTVPFSGPFATCLAARPKKGQQIAGFTEFGLTVKNTRITRLDADAGELLITLSTKLPDSEWQFVDPEEETEEETQVTVARFSVQFRSIEKDIHSLRVCGTISEAGIAAGITWDQWPAIEANAAYYEPSGAAGAWTYRDYVDLRAAGVESKLVYYPVVTRTIEYSTATEPADLGVKIGHKQTPPKFAIAGWEWICSGDGLDTNGDKVVRTTEWTACDDVIELLYPAIP